MTEYTLTCSDVDDRLADCLEGTLTATEQHAVDAHVAGCARCAALVRDLRDIANGARSLPALAPSRDLWAGIAERIETPVLPLESARPTARNTRRPLSMRALAIAAGLVFATAGVTYLFTVSRLRTPDPAARMAVVPSPDNQPIARDSTAPTSRAPLSAPFASMPAAETAAPAPGTDARSRLAANVEPAATSAAATAEVLDGEIARLRQLLAERRQDLDPRTAAVLESSLRVIDDAIAQSRAALASDPASGFLSEQLNRSLDKKVDLLRTAVLLPARTG
ncbi:MAG TPA: zf-HC2 domain-containing protein [Gemmatimonadaceae bacterium]|nr:zf-HC2 domain-containing protein [Gemmatimonadaceae bacterium]